MRTTLYLLGKGLLGAVTMPAHREMAAKGVGAPNCVQPD